MQYKTYILGIAILASAGAIALYSSTSTQPQNVAKPEDVIQQQYARANSWAAQDNTPEQANPALENLPASLRGTDIDGQFHLDEHGHLIIEPGLIRAFEYFMSNIGEEDISTIVARVDALIKTALPESAQEDAQLLLAQYLDYRQRQGDILAASQGNGDLATLRENFSQLKQMRRSVFGAEHADALFKDDESYLEFNLNSVELSQQGGNDLEQLANIRDLAASLSPQQRQRVEEQATQRELNIRTQQLQEEGASREQLRLMREQLIGSEAAERLATLDEQRNSWKQKIQDFKSAYENEIAQLEANNAPVDKSVIMENLMHEQSLSASELQRIVGILQL